MQPQDHSDIRVGGYRHISPQQIVRLEADRNYTLIHQANGQSFLVSTTLKVIEERLLPFGFVRITRGDVINKAFVKRIWKDGTVQLMDGTRVQPSRRRQGLLKSVLPDLD